MLAILKEGGRSKIGQNCQWLILKTADIGEGVCQKSGKIAWTFIPILKFAGHYLSTFPYKDVHV